MTMDFKSGYIAILMVYVTFGGFTRNLVHGANESTTTEEITTLTSTELTTLLVQVNISSTTSSSLGTSVSSTTSSTLETSVSSTTSSTLETSVSSTTSSSLGTSVSSDASSSLGTSVSSTTLSALGTSISMTTKLSSTTTASDTESVSISSTKFSDLMAAEPNTTLQASETSISSTTLSTIETSTSLAVTSTTVSSADQVTESLAAPGIGCQDWNTPCMNNGNCTPEGTCLCPSSWTGRQCEYPCFTDGCPSEMNVCIIDRKCNLNGTSYCANETGCFCFTGWNGSLCNISVCDNYYCYNDGKCKNVSGVAVCDCVGDAIGSHCEHNGNFSCNDMPSSARDRIISCIDNIGYYTLVCKPEWTGKNCETPINITDFCSSNKCDDENMEYCNAVCERGKCSQIYTGLNVEYESSAETETEGCTFSIGHPWNMCNTSNCIERFANGFCDSSCNNEDCLYDGYDCIGGKGFLEDCSPYFNTPCSYNLTFDGKCNPECNTTDCLYDGFDCALSGLSPLPLPGQLVIQVMQPHSQMDNIVRKIGLLLRSGINKTFSTDLKNENVVIAYLQLTCSELVNEKCFTSIQGAAKFLAAYVAKLTVPDLLVTDIFACEDGYYGDQGCQRICSHGCKNSTNREICHKYNGQCHDGCRDEFYGSTCYAQCNDNCGEGNGRRCNMDNGNCIYPCKKDYYGPECEDVCSKTCLASCNHNDGTCIGGCQGNLSYGSNCQTNCSKRCQNSTCDHLGKCYSCVIGYHGDNCANNCPEGCFEGCNQTTGDCFKCKTHHIGNKCKEDASYGQQTEIVSGKTDYTGVIVGVVASVFIIAGAILIAFLCWRRQQSGDYVLDEEAGTKTKANMEAVTTVQDQHTHMANFASSKG